MEFVKAKSLTLMRRNEKSVIKARSKFCPISPQRKSKRKWHLLRNTLSAIVKFRSPETYSITDVVFLTKIIIERCNKRYGGI